jgi:hypothetical protein
VLAIIRDKVRFDADGARCAAGPGTLAPAAPGVESVTLTVELRAGPLSASWWSATTSSRSSAPTITPSAGSTPEGRPRRSPSRRNRRELRVRLGTGGYRLADFVALGVEHIVTGWDHLLFLLALLLHGGGVLAMVKIVTAFTVAHSVTLSLAALEIVTCRTGWWSR